LALPMLDQGNLTGLALLERKADGAAYRPDEVALLGWAAHQVGLDLQALHARELEARMTDMERHIVSLTEERDRLAAILHDSLRPQLA